MNPEESYTVSAVRRRRRRTLSPCIKTPKDVYDLVAPLVREDSREHFYGIYLNSRSRVIKVELVSLGSLNASLVHPREVFLPAVLASAASVIVAHNHPSGESDPSDDDLRITRRLVDVGELLGIPLVDHVVIGEGVWESLRDRGCF